MKEDDESLLVIDGNILFHITREGLVRSVAGRSPLTPPSVQQKGNSGQRDIRAQAATNVQLNPLRGLAIGSDGAIYFGETNGHTVNRIRMVDPSGRLFTFAGGDPECDCTNRQCPCFNGDNRLVLNVLFFVPSAVAISPHGDNLYIADQGNVRVRSARVSLPKTSPSGYYLVPSEDGTEAYQFDRYGRHVSTILTSTSQTTYVFQYEEFGGSDRVRGLLTSIRDAYNNVFRIVRTSDGRPLGLKPQSGLNSTVQASSNGYLSDLTTPDMSTTQFTYSDGGLMVSMKEPSGLIHTFEYERSIASGRPQVLCSFLCCFLLKV